MQIIDELMCIVELSAIDKAEDVAQLAHLQQNRISGKPYIIHPKRVQLLAKKLGYGIDVQIIAILHDVLEEVENKKYYENLITSKFGKEIFSAIKLLSHDNNVEYNVYLEKLARTPFNIAKIAFKVKMLDMFDNLTDAPPEKQKEKYRNAIQYLVNKQLADNVPDVILKILQIEVLTEAPDKKEKSPVPEEPKKEPKDAPVNEPTDDVGGAPEDAVDVGGGGDAGGANTEGPDAQGGDIFGEQPPAGEGDLPGGDEAGNDGAENSIVQFNDKLNQSKIIDKQKTDAEPGFDFAHDNEFYRDNYISVTKNGSLLIGVPSVLQNNADKEFVKKSILPKIIKIAYNATKNGKDVVLFGEYGLPYYDGKYSNNVSGIIAKVLNDKFKNTILFDTINPQDYYGFISNTAVWKDLKARLEVENIDIKSALYLFLLATKQDKKTVNKLKTDDVIEHISKWGLSQNNIEMVDQQDEIYRVIFPDKYNSPETEPSHIIKMYLQLLRVNMLKKVIQYEKEGKVAIVPTDVNTSWTLNDSFKELQKIQQPKKEKQKEPDNKKQDSTNNKVDKKQNKSEVPDKKPDAKEKNIEAPEK